MEILEIAKIINENGGRLYLVGGAIRDKQLEKQNYDEDYCVTGISTKKFKELFPNAKIRGKSFEVFDIEKKEFAMARKEKKIGSGHKEFKIDTNEDITIQEDLARRDITINSIAQDVITKEIIDPYGGINDIKNKIIRATTNSFKEDPLRAYRVARFSATLGFSVDEKTIKMMKEMKEELETLSAERVFTEFKKALQSEKPSIFFEVLKKADVLDVHFKEIYDLIGSIQPIKYHPEGDSYNHTMIVVDKVSKITDNLEVRFAALVHDLGKGITPKEMYPHHYRHDIKGVKLVNNMANRLKIPNSWKKCGKLSAEEHMRGGIFNKMSPAKQVDFITKVNKSILGLDGMKIIVMCDKDRANNNLEDIKFDIIGKQCIKEINGEIIKQKYKNKSGIELNNIIRKERIEWIKKNSKNY